LALVPAPLRIGFLGCGRAAARLHLPALEHVDGVEAAAVADLDQARATRLAADRGIPRVYADLAALAADDEIDLIAVCTPPRHHAVAALAALDAGRHVLVEKPLCIDPEEADSLVRAAAERPDRVCAVGFNLRLHRQVVAARQAVAEGRLGRLAMIRTHWTGAARPRGWRSSAGEGGSPLWEMGVHHLDLWRHLTAEEPVRIAASAGERGLLLSAVTEGGTLLATTLANRTSEANEVELVGERGRLTLTLYRGDGPLWAPAGGAVGGPAVRLRAAARAARDLPRQARAARAGGDYLLSFSAEWEALAQAVHGHASAPPASFEDGRRAVAIVHAAEQALGAGDEIEIEA
jgi:myo-inositol 2-dehydrogenase / D-chiro-inositol 1-dehydrogenase